MSEFLFYILKSGLSLSTLYIIYWFLFRKNTFFQLNRIYLLLALVFSMIVPLLNLSFNDSNLVSSYSKVLDPIIVKSGEIEYFAAKYTIELRIFIIIYFAGTFICSLRFLLQAAQIFLLVKRHGITYQKGEKIVYVDRNFSPFSFFNIVFLPRQKEQDEILIHELIHVKQKHSLDILFVEIISILQWFNPFIWLYKSSLKSIHEYLADEGVILKGFNTLNYQNLLLMNILGMRLNDLTANFNYLPLKNRIKMMKTKKSNKSKAFKYLLVMPILAGIILYYGCERTFLNNQEESGKERVYSTVEVMPEFPGGIEAVRKFIAQNLTYPESAAANGISGRIFVKFIVNKEGKVVNPEIIRTNIKKTSPENEVVVVGYRDEGKLTGDVDPDVDALEKEAIRVVSMIPDFTPGMNKGKKVNVGYTFPIVFALQ